MAKKTGSVFYTPPSESFWTIPGVVHRGETGKYRVFEKLTPLMTQDKLIEIYGIQIPNSQLVYAITSKGRELNAESLRQFLKSCFRQYTTTSTRVENMPEGEIDRVIHNYGTSEQYLLDVNLVGVDGWIKDIPDKQVLEAILGESDVDKINEVSKWVNGTDSRIWRLNSKPEQKEERAVRFNAYVNRLYFTCSRLLAYESPSLRVERIE